MGPCAHRRPKAVLGVYQRDGAQRHRRNGRQDVNDELQKRLRSCIDSMIFDITLHENFNGGVQIPRAPFAMKHIGPLIEDLAAKLDRAECEIYEIEEDKAALRHEAERIEREYGTKLEAAEKEKDKITDSYMQVVCKFAECRDCLASVYRKLFNDSATPPDDYEGTWHEWLIKEVVEKLEAAEKDAANRARAVTVDWEKTNARRVTLIRKEIAGKSSMAEKQELARLQVLADFRIEIFAPLTARDAAEEK